jgi:3-hydroxybutyryl-CoA dehydrogenase
MVERIAVVGAGLMGHGLAQVFASAGHPVAIYDPQADARASVRERVAANLRTLGGDPAAAERIEPVADLAEAVAGAAFVVEAAPEDPDLKHELFGRLEGHVGPEAILATNTSVIPVGRITGGLRTAHRMVGTHFWNPPYLIPLVEVVQSQDTDVAVVERTLDLLRRVGKTPVHVRKDVPGFVGNRLQHALWREAIALVADGVCDAATVDTVVRSGFGARLAVMGPLENADLIGLDLTLAIHEQIIADLDVSPGPNPLLRKLIEQGRLGMKTGEGLQRWPAGSAEAAHKRLLRHLSALTPTQETTA